MLAYTYRCIELYEAVGIAIHQLAFVVIFIESRQYGKRFYSIL